MKAIFVGRTRPYARKPERGGGIAYGAVVALPDKQEAGTVQGDTFRCTTTQQVDSLLLGVESGTLIDFDMEPRLFGGKVSGFDINGING